ncbi:PEGA domain-containing protein [Candidatus Woesearchaeota archaeon]|nr:PEGA domain-containing protein [Candidatus Woesearchaeota archaeon]
MKCRNFLAVLFAVILVFSAGCKAAEKEQPAETAEEQLVDTGSAEIESSPGMAQVYVGEEYKGDTPVSLYNLPVGQYEITIMKEGYADFKKAVTIRVGRTEEISAALIPAGETNPSAGKPAKETEKPAEAMPQNTSAASKSSKISLSSFAMYYDFEKAEFTEIRTDGSDLFSRKYENYLHFTAITPAKINVLDKPISEAEKEDCIFSDTAVAQVFSQQTLCVKTGTGIVVAIGGEWKEMPGELEIKPFS